MRLLALSTLAAASICLAPQTAAPAAAAGLSCIGQQATVVGVAGQETRGTGGDDVIVSNGSRRVEGRGGDDLICLTDPPPDGLFVSVDAGPGDDRVQVDTAVQIYAKLGPGRDRYRGGGGPDEVMAAGDRSRDLISTRGGDDIVRLSGRKGRDKVLTGSGQDQVWTNDNPSISLDGGPDADSLVFISAHEGSDTVVDDSTQTARRDGEVVLRWQDFEGFSLPSRSARQRFVGTPGPDEVMFGFAAEVVSAHTGNGADRISVSPLNRTSDGSALDGGPGSDVIWSFSTTAYGEDDIAYARRITIDLSQGTAVFRRSRATSVIRLRGLENVEAYGSTVRVTGDDQANRLDVAGCDVQAHGGAGADTLQSTVSRYVDDDLYCSPADYSFYGDDGPDMLLGTPEDDVLVGGSGDDTADGGPGHDTCDAEAVTECEA